MALTLRSTHTQECADLKKWFLVLILHLININFLLCYQHVYASFCCCCCLCIQRETSRSTTGKRTKKETPVPSQLLFLVYQPKQTSYIWPHYFLHFLRIFISTTWRCCTYAYFDVYLDSMSMLFHYIEYLFQHLMHQGFQHWSIYQYARTSRRVVAN